MMKLIFAFVLGCRAVAAVPEKLITEHISKKISAVASPEKWKDFVKNNEKLFPPTSKNNPEIHVIVQKEELNIDGDSYTLGVGYRQSFIKAPIERVKKILSTPSIFKSLYGLDAPAEIDSTGSKMRSDSNKKFQARIFKQVPLMPNQDYILEYNNDDFSDLFLQRTKLVKDREKFGLRENLMVLESASGGTILREVSVLYALKWYVRFFGPSVREVTNKELAKITESVKCLAESGKEINDEAAGECWKISSGN